MPCANIGPFTAFGDVSFEGEAVIAFEKAWEIAKKLFPAYSIPIVGPIVANLNSSIELEYVAEAQFTLGVNMTIPFYYHEVLTQSRESERETSITKRRACDSYCRPRAMLYVGSLC